MTDLFYQSLPFTRVRFVHETNVPYSDMVSIKSSKECADFFRRAYEAKGCEIEYKEYFFLAITNRSNKIISVEMIGEGGFAGVVADVKVIANKLALTNGSGFFICHNHPSGNLSPSDCDITLTKKVSKMAEYHDYVLMDHIILTASSYTSLADDNKLN